jgi:flagellar motility protein MotE (MotC chaperone)
MKTLIQLVVVALIFGGISAAATIFTQKQAAPTVAAADGQPPAAAATSHEDAAPTDAKPADPKSAGDESKHEVTDEKKPAAPEENPLAAAEAPRGPQAASKRPPLPDIEPGHGDAGKEASASPEARVAVRPPYTPEGDEAGALINLLRDRARQATETERRLAERQDAMQLIFEDLRAEQAQTLKIRQRLANELKESREAVDAEFQIVETERASIKKDVEEARRAADAAVRAAVEERDKLRKQLEKSTTPTPEECPRSNSTAGTPEDNLNIKKMAAVFDGMPADNVAKVFEQLVKNKRTEAVIALMNAMKERQAAKVLATISDTNAELAADLTDRLKRLKAAEKPAAE